MAQFAIKFTDLQRMAVVDAALTSTGATRQSVRQVIRAAKAGQLAGLEPFEMSYSYACDMVSAERERRTGTARARETLKDPAAAIDAMALRLVRLHDRELTRIERAAQNGPRAHLDADKARGLTRNLRELRALIDAPSAAPSKGNAKSANGTGQDTPREPTAVDRAREALAREASTEPSPSAPIPKDVEGTQENATGTETTLRSDEREHEEDDAQDADAVSSHVDAAPLDPAVRVELAGRVAPAFG